jgi:DNA transformation protein and related proteins
MSVSRGFQDFVLELLTALNPVARRMFSGVGLFHSGVMFGLLVRDTLYLRVDASTRPRFEQAGSRPFSYKRGDRDVSLGAYYEIPDGMLDQPDELLQWARDAVVVARAARRR